MSGPVRGRWRFDPLGPGEILQDPVQDEFFATEALDELTDALVREAVQNSLDAAADPDEHPGPVTVGFRFTDVPGSAVDPWLVGLVDHARAAGLDRNPGPTVRLLTVEDTGTRGLEGDPARTDDPEPGRSGHDDFYWFWWNVGRSGKADADRGRWGLGKVVFPLASELRAFWGLTLRRGDEAPLLMGQAVLRIHTLDGRRYRPYGWWADPSRGRPSPVSDPADLDAFAGLTGVVRTEPGLSVVIPALREEVTPEAVRDAAARHYFWPVMRGALVIGIADGDRRWRLDADTIDRHATGRLVELARWGHRNGPTATARAPQPGSRAQLTAELFNPDALARLRERFEAGLPCAVRLAVPVEPADGPPVECPFTVLIQRDPDASRDEGTFIRNGITVPNPGARRPRGVRWLVVVEDPVLTRLLGDAENPAHTEWQRKAERLRRFVRGPSTVDFVRGAPAKLTELLTTRVSGPEPDLLADLFSLTDTGGATWPRPDPAGTDDATTTPPELESRPPDLQLTPVAGGFTASGDRPTGTVIEITAAYVALRADAFRRWSPHDFTMDRLRVRASGARAEPDPAVGNRLVVTCDGGPFRVTVTGFDVLRDLRIRVDAPRPAGARGDGP